MFLPSPPPSAIPCCNLSLPATVSATVARAAPSAGSAANLQGVGDASGPFGGALAPAFARLSNQGGRSAVGPGPALYRHRHHDRADVEHTLRNPAGRRDLRPQRLQVIPKNSARRQLGRRYYLRRFRSQASLISKTTIITMVVTRIGPANIANIVSISVATPARIRVNV